MIRKMLLRIQEEEGRVAKKDVDNTLQVVLEAKLIE